MVSCQLAQDDVKVKKEADTTPLATWNTRVRFPVPNKVRVRRTLNPQNASSSIINKAYLSTDLALKLLGAQLHVFDADMSTHGRLALEGDGALGALEDLVSKVLLTVLRIAAEVGALFMANLTFDGSTVGLLHVAAKVGLGTETLLAYGALVDQLLNARRKYRDVGCLF